MEPLKRIVLTQPAADSMLERNFRMEWIEAAARRPDWREPDPDDAEVERRFRVIPELEGRVFRVACVEDDRTIRVVTAFSGSRSTEAEMKLDMTYDPEADATYVRFSESAILESEEVFPGVILDFDTEGRVVAMEVLAASKVLAPGGWQKARPPGQPSADAAE